MDKFEAAKFNLNRELQGMDAMSLIDRVINKINDDLLASSKRDVRAQKAKPVFSKADKAIDSPLDVLKLIDDMRQQKLQRAMQKATAEERKSMQMTIN